MSTLKMRKRVPKTSFHFENLLEEQDVANNNIIQGVPYGNGGFRSLIMKNLHTFQNFRRHHSWRYKPTFWFLEKNRKKFFFRKKNFVYPPIRIWNCGVFCKLIVEHWEVILIFWMCIFYQFEPTFWYLN